MSRVTTIQTNFTAGELSEELFGRVDISKYVNGAETIENFIVHPHGGISRRPGTRFVKEIKTSAAKTRLIPFEFSTTQAYVIEFGNLYCRFYKDKGSILEGTNAITGATAANPVVLTVSNSYTNGDEIYISGVAGMTELNGKYFKVASVSGSSVALTNVDGTNINGSAYTAYSSAGTTARVYTLTTTFATADLPQLQFAQSADILYISHSSYAPKKMSRTGHTSWTITDIAFTDGPYQTENITATTLTPGAATGSGVTFTASAATGINGGDGFQAADVGRLISVGHQATKWAASTAYALAAIVRNSGNVYECIKAGTSDSSGGPSGEGDEIVDGGATWKYLRDGGIQWGYGTIASRASTTVITVNIVSALGGTSAETKWRLGAWSNQTGWPGAVAFYEQRLFWAGSVDQPQTIWGSKSGDYENHTPGTLDNDPVIYTLATDQVNAIRWLSPGKVMAVGTVGGEFVISGSTTADPLTPTNVRVVREGTRGSSQHKPVRIDNVVMFIQRQQRKIREFIYAFESDAYQSPDLTILSPQVAKGGVTEIIFQQEPNAIIWGIKADGQLVGLTYLRDQKVVAWHRHKIGGSFSSTAWGIVESLAIIPGTGEDELWMIVKRTINGVTRRYVEFLESTFDADEGMVKSGAFFVDSGLTYSGSATATVSGLDHLEGETVQILGNGNVYPDQAVASGGLSAISPTITTGQIGLGSTALVKTLRPEAGADDGAAQGKTKRPFELAVRFIQTLGAKVSTNGTDYDTVQFRSGSDPMDSSPPLYSGDKKIKLRGGWNEEGQIWIKQDQPLPIHVTAIITRLVTNDG